MVDSLSSPGLEDRLCAGWGCLHCGQTIGKDPFLPKQEETAAGEKHLNVLSDHIPVPTRASTGHPVHCCISPSLSPGKWRPKGGKEKDWLYLMLLSIWGQSGKGIPTLRAGASRQLISTSG